MKNKTKGMKLLAVIAACASVVSAIPVFSHAASENSPALTYYVATDGNDSAKGTEDDPFATVAAARDAIRALSAESGLPDGGITVYLREGVYYQTETLTFTAEDSGTEACPITYKSYEGETARISGGYPLDTSKLVKPSDEILARLQTEDAKAHVMAYDLGADGIDYSYIETNLNGRDRIDSRIYVDGVRGWPGRYPNDEPGVDGYLNFVEFNSSGGYSIKDASGRVANWDESALENARMGGMFEIDWAQSYGKITGYDPETQRVSYTGSYSYISGRYFYYNVLEEVDEIGEHYIDTDTGMLYVYLPENYEDSHVTFALLREHVLRADVEYYTFDGLIIESGVDGLMNLNGDNNTIKNCKVRDCSDDGIVGTGDNINIVGNEIYNIGGGGITWNGGDANRMVSGNITISDNVVHDFGEIHRVYAGAFFVNGFGYEISHNEVYRAPHTMMTSTAGDLLFEYNYVHDVCYEAGDAGAIYTGGWGASDYIIRHNVMKDVTNVFNPYLNPTGFYSDNAGGGKQVYSNIFINIEGPAVHVAGQNNHVYDNIIVDSSIYTDSRAYYKFPGNTISGWITSAVYTPTPQGLWYDLLNNPAYGSEMWYMRGPWTMLLKHTNVYDLEDNFVGYAYGDSTVRGNAIKSVGTPVFTTKESGRLMNIRDNAVITDISDFGFVDFENGNYAISEDSKLYRYLPGIKVCDFANVGVREVD